MHTDETPAVAAWRLPAIAVTIRGQIILAFCAFAAVTGLLGLAAFNSVVDSGRLVVETYDKPMISISYARRALADFMAMELAAEQGQSRADATGQRTLAARIDVLAGNVSAELRVAEERSMSARAASLAHETSRVVEEWSALRRRLSTAAGNVADQTAFAAAAAAAHRDFDRLVELTVGDSFASRASALAAGETYRRLSIAVTLGALLLGAAVAVFMVRRMIRPIATASRVARCIAEGRLDVEIIPAGGDELGQLLESMALMRDNIRDMMEREIAARRQAEAADRAKTEFVANMSHELRTPLNAVIGFSEIIASEMFGPVGQPRYKEFACDIGRSGNHLLQVINHILDIAKLHAGKMQLWLEPVCVGDLIEDAVRIMKERATSQGIMLDCEIEPDLPRVEADATRLRQVLLNLLSNAIKFTPERGSIAVTASRCGEGVRIAVSDTGIGIAAKDIPTALEPFSQIDGSLTRKYEGTGLGLPLSKLFTERHGGQLSIDSTPGRGTTVAVILPVLAPA